jgi:hypothetical protein
MTSIIRTTLKEFSTGWNNTKKHKSITTTAPKPEETSSPSPPPTTSDDKNLIRNPPIDISKYLTNPTILAQFAHQQPEILAPSYRKLIHITINTIQNIQILSSNTNIIIEITKPIAKLGYENDIILSRADLVYVISKTHPSKSDILYYFIQILIATLDIPLTSKEKIGKLFHLQEFSYVHIFIEAFNTWLLPIHHQRDIALEGLALIAHRDQLVGYRCQIVEEFCMTDIVLEKISSSIANTNSGKLLPLLKFIATYIERDQHTISTRLHLFKTRIEEQHGICHKLFSTNNKIAKLLSEQTFLDVLKLFNSMLDAKFYDTIANYQEEEDLNLPNITLLDHFNTITTTLLDSSNTSFYLFRLITDHPFPGNKVYYQFNTTMWFKPEICDFAIALLRLVQLLIIIQPQLLQRILTETNFTQTIIVFLEMVSTNHTMNDQVYSQLTLLQILLLKCISSLLLIVNDHQPNIEQVRNTFQTQFWSGVGDNNHTTMQILIQIRDYHLMIRSNHNNHNNPNNNKHILKDEKSLVLFLNKSLFGSIGASSTRVRKMMNQIELNNVQKFVLDLVSKLIWNWECENGGNGAIKSSGMMI